MTDIKLNISEEELAEIEEIKELAQGCTNYLLESIINTETGERIELEENDKKAIFKLVLNKTMEFIEECSFPSNEEDFAQYVETVLIYMQEKL
ncbi:hypothetical protein [Terrisporobacter glycolicus]|uniref:Phage protein n=1 Tax=Terrisporobacter glycolicus ATCC 14880 = DSM 1288 TaxID=1121315 RepID=A0ABZ2EXF6_9FIRM|nr:hypothetical protein [Terrisporobacter glycolicus]